MIKEIQEYYNNPLLTDKSNKKKPKVLILGSTGAGKSAFCNSLIADFSSQSFKESERLDSYTQKTVSKEVTWFDGKETFELIDTPGMNDSDSKDSFHLNYLVDYLKDQVVYLNAFVLVINGASPRLDESIKAMLVTFTKMFGSGFLNQTIIVFTRWPYDEKAVLNRKLNNENEEDRVVEVNNKIRELMMKVNKSSNKAKETTYTHSSLSNSTKVNNSNTSEDSIFIPCYFLCNNYNKKEVAQRSTESEIFQYLKTLKSIKSRILDFPVYYCNQIKKELSEKDYLRKKLEIQIKKNKLHKITSNGCKLCDCLQYCYSTEEFKKYSSATIAATSSGGGLIGGFAGLITGAGLGSMVSGAMYFNVHVCYCGHDKKDHYSLYDKKIYEMELENGNSGLSVGGYSEIETGGDAISNVNVSNNSSGQDNWEVISDKTCFDDEYSNSRSSNEKNVIGEDLSKNKSSGESSVKNSSYGFFGKIYDGYNAIKKFNKK